jgi:hypothetical protein
MISTTNEKKANGFDEVLIVWGFGFFFKRFYFLVTVEMRGEGDGLCYIRHKFAV